MTCVKCGTVDDDVYYAPTCGFLDTKCPSCGHVTDLEAETGISYEDASNAGAIAALVGGLIATSAEVEEQ